MRCRTESFKTAFLPYVAFAFALYTIGGLLDFARQKSGIFKDFAVAEKSAVKSSGTMLFGVLSGYSAVLADFVWIASYGDWETRSVAKCTANMELALALNPNMKSFWSMASAITAYDMPYWIADEKHVAPQSAEFKRIERIQAKKGAEYLKKALLRFPDNRTLLIQLAELYEKKLGDLNSAIACYERAVLADKSTVFTRRALAELYAKYGNIPKAEAILNRLLGESEKNSPIYESLLEQLNKIRAKANR